MKERSIVSLNLDEIFPRVPVYQFPQLTLPPHLTAALEAFAKNPMIRIARSLQETAERMERELSALEPHAKALGERGWTIPMVADIPFVWRMIEEVSPDRLDAAFVRHYSVDEGRHAKEVFAGLMRSDGLGHWRPLLRQAIASYRRRQYQLVVPSLLLIFEGAIAKTVGLLDRKSAPKASIAKRRSEAKGPVTRLIWVSLEGFIGEVFREHHFGSARPLRVNRHWIMHGRDVPDWDRADCLRLFQAIHTLRV